MFEQIKARFKKSWMWWTSGDLPAPFPDDTKEPLEQVMNALWVNDARKAKDILHPWIEKRALEIRDELALT
jgi:hypothetical protein